jgi:hypothetical protein
MASLSNPLKLHVQINVNILTEILTSCVAVEQVGVSDSHGIITVEINFNALLDVAKLKDGHFSLNQLWIVNVIWKKLCR